MIDWFILFILIGEVIILAKIDKINYGTWITPFSLLAVPYTIVVITAFFFAPVLGFISLYVESVLIWIVGLFLFWLGGVIIALPLGKRIRVKAKVDHPFLYEKESEKLALILAWITISVMCYGLFATLQSLGWQQIGTDEFAKSYGYGWIGHFRLFSMGLAIFLIGTASRENIFKMFTILILIVLYMMYPTKSWVIIPILAGFIYRLSRGRFKASFTKTALFLLLVYAFFNVVYLIGYGAKDIESIYNIEIHEYLITHFISYIFSGVMGLSNVVQAGLTNIHYDPGTIFAPFINLYAVIFSGDLVGGGIENRSVVSIFLDKESNVNTLFGTILLNLGFLPSIIYVFFFGIVTYGLFAIAQITRNCWAEVALVFIGAMLSLGWFDIYLSLLPAIEVPVYCAVLGFLSWLLGWRYQRKCLGLTTSLSRGCGK